MSATLSATDSMLLINLDSIYAKLYRYVIIFLLKLVVEDCSVNSGLASVTFSSHHPS